jgi:parallel beta-helix repeat protein
MKMRKKIPIVLLLCLAATVAMAAGPNRISYQGSLTDSTGAPIADGPYKMRFTIYDAPSTATLLWQETQPGVVVTGGLFSVELGAVGGLSDSIFDNTNLYLEVEVDLNGNAAFEANEKYAPRQHLTKAAFAYRSDKAATALDADTVDGKQASDLLDKATYDANLNSKVDAAEAADSATNAADSDLLDGMDSTAFSKPMFEAIVAPSGGDYTSIQDALTAGKKKIFVRNGTYVLTSDINITTSGTVIVGESRDCVIIDCNGTGYCVHAYGDTGDYTAGSVSIANGTKIVTGSGTAWLANAAAGEYIMLMGDWYKIASVDNDTQLTLVETYYGRTLASTYYRIARMLENIRLENLTVRNFNFAGWCAILWEYVLNSQLVNCSADNNFWYGMGLGPIYHCKINKNFARHNVYGITLYDSSSNSLYENSCSNNAAYGIDIGSYCQDNCVSGNACNNNDDGIYVDSAYLNTISGNSCSGNDSAGIWLTTDADNNTVSANTCYGNTDGIYLSGADFNSLTGNYCSYNANNGIYLLSNAYANTVTGNSCYYNDNDGIRLNAGYYGTVTANSCYDNTTSGIELYSSDDNSVTANSTRGNGSDGITLTSDADNNSVMANSSTGNGGWGINIATANCNTNIAVGNQIILNTSGQGNNGGTGTIIANNNGQPGW